MPTGKGGRRREESGGLSAAEAAALAAEIRGAPGKAVTVAAAGSDVHLTNLDKVFWPPFGDRPSLLKRDLLAYYAEVAPRVLPYLRDRPLTLRRYVDGVTAEGFYQRDWHDEAPAFVRIVPIHAPTARRDFRSVVCENPATLLWLANSADIEMHAWYARLSADGAPWPETFAGSEDAVEASTLNYPDYLVLDLDPWVKAEGAEATHTHRLEALAACKAVAGLLRERLEAWGLTAFVKTSGKTGLHLFVPVERRYRFETTREVARGLAREMAAAHPDLVTAEWRKEKRRGKVLVDHMQNARAKTLPAPWSLRASEAATVSTPLRWEDLPAADSYDFTLLTAPGLLRERGDPWAGILERRGSLDAACADLGGC